MEIYEYSSFKENQRKSGYIIGVNKRNAVEILKRNGVLPISISKAYFFHFNRMNLIRWFDSLYKLISSGFSVEDSLLIVSQEDSGSDIYVNVIDSLSSGKNFAEIIIENNWLISGTLSHN